MRTARERVRVNGEDDELLQSFFASPDFARFNALLNAENNTVWADVPDTHAACATRKAADKGRKTQFF